MERRIKIELSPELPEDIEQLLRMIFWKEKAKDKEIIKAAKEFLDYVREWGRTQNPHTADQWENYCLRKNVTQSRYHNILKRLKAAGIVEKTYNKNRGKHEICLSGKFSATLNTMQRLWDNYRSA